MSMEMNGLLRGAELGLIVAIPPGATWAVCIVQARAGMTAATPVIFTAALTDCVYGGVCVAARFLAASAGFVLALRWASPVFLAATAAALWRRGSSGLSAGSSSLVAALNPATLGVWISHQR